MHASGGQYGEIPAHSIGYSIDCVVGDPPLKPACIRRTPTLEYRKQRDFIHHRHGHPPKLPPPPDPVATVTLGNCISSCAVAVNKAVRSTYD